VHKRALGLAVIVIVGAMLVSASGAATTKAQRVTRIDVSTRAAVIHYLHSIHVKAKGAVIQRGSRNYAGARCPGRGWTCASTKHTVVQIAKLGGQNRFVCKSSKCAVVQISGLAHGVYLSGPHLAGKGGGGNSGVCVKTGSAATTGTGQSCTINQSGTGSNTAVVYENSLKVSGLMASAAYTAVINQTATDGTHGNKACVTQNINLDGSTTGLKGKPVTVSLQGHQSVIITQDAAGSGPNTAATAAVASGTTAICDPNNGVLGQSQILTSTVNGISGVTQNIGDQAILCGDGVTGPVGVGDYANLCLDIEQNQTPANTNPAFPAGFVNNPSVTGANNANFNQSDLWGEIANSTNGPVKQTEGNPDPAVGGIVGTINQWSYQTQAFATATQHERECEDAATGGLTPGQTTATTNWCDITGDPGKPSYTVNQNQYGPAGFGSFKGTSGGIHAITVRKGLGQAIQLGDPSDQYSVTQTSTQTTDAGSNVTNHVVGDCTTDGNCTAGQTTTINGAPTQDGYASKSINNLRIDCSNTSTCAPTPPPAPVITTTADGTPAAQTTLTDATFTWTEAATAGVTLKCSIDGGTTFTTCGSATSTSYTGLSHGPKTFEVKAVDNFGNESAADSFSWEIIPYLTFETSGTGASAGWSSTPGSSPITLTTGAESTTYAQFTIHDRSDLKVSDLASLEPSFNTDAYIGAPRYEIDLDNGDYLFGYPPQAGFGSNSWDINCGGTNISCVPASFVTWAQVQAAEGTATITDALVEADFPTNHTYSIADFTFDNYGPSDVAP
jgi:hypothetical protein